MRTLEAWGLSLAGAALGATVLATGVIAQSRLSVRFSWCSGSPTFSLASVPKGTAKLNFRMVDLQAPGYNHGGGEISYSGQKSIPCGAMNATYTGPSPPSGSHTYRWYVQALDAGGSVLAETTTERNFPEL